MKMKVDQSNLPSSGHSVCEQLDGRILIEVPHGASQSSVGMAWHGMARPLRRRSAVLFAIPRRYWDRGAFVWMQGCALALRVRLVV
jgi:hypothetical protein